jgi:hypothetical protein
MNWWRRTLLSAAVIAPLGLIVSACEEGPGEEAGEAIDETAEEAGEAAEEAGEAAKEAGEEAEDAAD